MFCIKRDTYFLNSIHFELSSATSIDLDQLTILLFSNEILHSGKNIVEKEEIAWNKQFLYLQQYYVSKGLLMFLTKLTWIVICNLFRFGQI